MEACTTSMLTRPAPRGMFMSSVPQSQLRLQRLTRCMVDGLLERYFLTHFSGQVQLTVKGSSNRTLPRFEEPI